MPTPILIDEFTGPNLTRRSALGAMFAALAAPGSFQASGENARAFRLVEAAGLRRFGYPVHAIVPDAAGGRNYRLIRDGQAIPAQFRQTTNAGGQPQVELDFVASPEPLSQGRYQVWFGPAVEPGPEPQAGLTVDRVDDLFRIKQAGGLTFEVASSLDHGLRAAGSPRLAYVRAGAPGFRIGRLDGSRTVLGAGRTMTTLISRQGPMAVALRSTGTTDDVASTIEITVPHSKSWIQVEWTCADPSGSVAALGFELDLLLEAVPTVVDLGAGSTVYGQVKPGERMELVAGTSGESPTKPAPAWSVLKGDGKSLGVLAAAAPGGPGRAEGWAHVMDARRCTAVAVAGFGVGAARDRLAISGEGRLTIERDFAAEGAKPMKGPKSLAFWLHFVPTPVQVGAATSPQAILAPLRVEWDRPPSAR
jgi:hypothetical protein